MLCPGEARHLGQVAEGTAETTADLCVPGKHGCRRGSGQKGAWQATPLVQRLHANKSLEAQSEVGRGLA